MNKLRLLLFKDCDRNCEGCCNQYWDLDGLPIERNFSKYDMVLLTGGEPLLKPLVVIDAVKEIRKQNDCPIYLYTAMPKRLSLIWDLIDGATVTLHDNSTVYDLASFNLWVIGDTHSKSLRLNVFKGVEFNEKDYTDWIIKKDMEWVTDCPLPKDEVFKRYL